MKQLLTLLRWDTIHLYRNQLISISVILGLIYFGLFYLIRDFTNADDFLVLLIYNDPVITGYVFAAVLLLFERNQNTLSALSVSPLRLSAYLWSKALVLSFLAWIIAFMMTLAARGGDVHWFHFSFGVLSSTLLFVFAGFAITAGCTSLNALIARSVPIFVVFALPFLGLFEIVNTTIWYLIPTYPGILLIKTAFSTAEVPIVVYSYTYGTLGVAIFYLWAISRVSNKISLS
jgi:hypothetical protein